MRSTVAEREAREVIRGSIPGEVERATPPSVYNNDIYKTTLSSTINNNEIYNNLYRNSLSGYVNTSIMNLNNRITTTNNLLQADFNLLEAAAFSSVASNFVNIIGSLVEAYMILNFKSNNN